MISVVIIGNGNVAYHITKAFLKADNVDVKQVYARSINKIAYLKNSVSITNKLELLKDADVYIISVSDDAIPEVSSMITNKKALVVHTSGSVSLNLLQNKGRKGVFYLLQSFSKSKEVNFEKIPFCLEAKNKKDLALLEELALTIGKKIYHINSQQRQQLHVAAVFVNNFVNHMYKIGNDICDEYNVPFEVLHPLIMETATKIDFLSPKEAQTGPAIRNDQKTIKNHLDLLNENQQEIYKLLTQSIQNG
ncbi:putative short-subunit dehydrogenase-like oxidoreductase (DUF2520 family) [Tenacibaculum adriaticum]|uniref:Putative short-subunit dehydrogenase-like oxidoreductase (DUF2520 family) n=1 Tax=Tenacibaculum adriaticum TaxID=413713 RepID=A0A5S5DLC0_9FLAO|nr:Rossmann-like and DUF2520 domain-containing protein [Tenacibaculum adriaticum]TYP96723.1 putative short-subunit dehydrogenase-like oxidoreductase (DUF2520 family) [Tenacibaculum adriaticum]